MTTMQGQGGQCKYRIVSSLSPFTRHREKNSARHKCAVLFLFGLYHPENLIKGPSILDVMIHTIDDTHVTFQDGKSKPHGKAR